MKLQTRYHFDADAAVNFIYKLRHRLPKIRKFAPGAALATAAAGEFRALLAGKKRRSHRHGLES